MTSDLTLLHAAVLTEPAEDTPRLAYADCLDERALPGDAERATFIRVQCGQPRRTDDRPEYLWLAAQRALRDHGREWRKCGPCPKCEGRGRIPPGAAPVVAGPSGGGTTLTAGAGGAVVLTGGPGAGPQCGHCRGTGDVGVLTAENCEFRRGFVARIDAPLADVMRPAGEHFEDWAPTDRARAWIAAHPLEEVVPTDREPREWPASVDHVGSWIWYDGRGTGLSGLSGTAHHIPAPVWDLLEGGGRRASHPHCMHHATAEAARSALARAVARWLRSFR